MILRDGLNVLTGATAPVKTMNALEVVASLTIPDVLALIDEGEMTVDEAIDAEMAGKQRVRLLNLLRSRE